MNEAQKQTPCLTKVELSNLTTRQQAPRASCLNSTSSNTNGYLAISLKPRSACPFIDKTTPSLVKDPDASRRP